MGTCYEVDAVRERGIRLSHYPMEAYPVGKFHGRLVAICDRMIFKQAVDLTQPSEYKLFYEQYRAGHLISFDLFDFHPIEGDRSP